MGGQIGRSHTRAFRRIRIRTIRCRGFRRTTPYAADHLPHTLGCTILATETSTCRIATIFLWDSAPAPNLEQADRRCPRTHGGSVRPLSAPLVPAWGCSAVVIRADTCCAVRVASIVGDHLLSTRSSPSVSFFGCLHSAQKRPVNRYA